MDVNQGIAALHAGVGAPVWLQRAAADCDRAVDRLDELTSSHEKLRVGDV